jgi:hypothetical protein
MSRKCLDAKPAAVRLTPNPSAGGSRKEAHGDEDAAERSRETTRSAINTIVARQINLRIAEAIAGGPLTNAEAENSLGGARSRQFLRHHQHIKSRATTCIVSRKMGKK